MSKLYTSLIFFYLFLVYVNIWLQARGLQLPTYSHQLNKSCLT